MIEAHPNFSEGPHLRSSYLTRKLISAKIKLRPDEIITWPEYTKTSFFETRLAFRRFCVEEPSHSGNTSAEMCYLYRRTRRWYNPETRLHALRLGAYTEDFINV